MICDGCNEERQTLKRTEKDERFLCVGCSNPNLIKPVDFKPLMTEFFKRLNERIDLILSVRKEQLMKLPEVKLVRNGEQIEAVCTVTVEA